MPGIMSTLPSDFAERLWTRATLIQARSGRTILALGAKSDNVYIILEGRVQAKLFSLSGREVILTDMAEGQIFGEIAAIDQGPRSASVVALTDCQLASVPGETFRSAVAELPSAATWLARRLVAQIRGMTDRIFELNALQVRSRLHCELLRQCDRDGRLKPSTTHAELAARVGTHREAITREMRVLVQLKIVEQDRRVIRVTNLPALIQLVRIATGDMDTDFLKQKGIEVPPA
jgi:CRP-like cAMP-binding protein